MAALRVVPRAEKGSQHSKVCRVAGLVLLTFETLGF
jgi:hypothetical protein